LGSGAGGGRKAGMARKASMERKARFLFGLVAKSYRDLHKDKP
jgi:hypothetical protein